MRWCASIAVVVVLLSFASAQQTSADKTRHLRFSLVVPDGVASETVQIQYLASGSFGGYGTNLKPQQGLKAYELDAETATNIKVIAYMPGCSIVTLDLTPEMPATEELGCRPLPTVSLLGQIVPMDVLKGKRTEVTITHGVLWAHGFFGYRDGIAMTFRAATVIPNEEGRFTVSLPDLTQDAVSSSRKEKGEWQFLLRDVGTGNIIATLNPTEARNNAVGLSIRSSYPEVVTFTAVPN